MAADAPCQFPFLKFLMAKKIPSNNHSGNVKNMPSNKRESDGARVEEVCANQAMCLEGEPGLAYIEVTRGEKGSRVNIVQIKIYYYKLQNKKGTCCVFCWTVQPYFALRKKGSSWTRYKIVVHGPGDHVLSTRAVKTI